MYAYREQTDGIQDQKAYYCRGCGVIYLGEPINEEGIETENSVEAGQYVSPDEYRIVEVWKCHDDPPCLYYSNEFEVKTVAEIQNDLGDSDVEIRNPDGGTVPTAVWKCGQCEQEYFVNYWGEEKAKEIAVNCCK